MNKSVLIVEDEFLIAMDIQDMLERLGWRVIGPASSVSASLRLIETDVPSVAVLDMNLGKELVTPVAEALRARGVPFILASATASPAELGGEVFRDVPNVGKPLTERDLVTTLARVTAQHDEQRA